MRHTRHLPYALALLFLASSACDRPEPSAEAWSGSVGAIEALNGMTVTLVRGEERITGMRDGSVIPAGTEVHAQPGVVVQLETTGGDTIILDGGSVLVFDKMEARRARLESGRAAVKFSSNGEGGSFALGGKVFEGAPGASVTLEVGDQRGAVAVLEGSGSIGEREILARQAVEIVRGVEEVRHFAAWDLSERTAWLDRDQRLVGYGTFPENDAMELVDHLVDVTITHGFAETRLVESFVNSSDRPAEMDYTFELPEGATPVEVALEENGEWIVSDVETNASARSKYEGAIGEGKRAVILSVDGRRVRVESGNVPPGEKRSLRIRWVGELAKTYGGSRYRYEMPWARDEGHRAQRFAITVRAPGVKPERFAAWGYDAKVEGLASGMEASFEAGDFVPAGDFVADILAEEDGTVVREARGEEEFVALTIRPDFQAPTPAGPFDLLVVLDTSKSRLGQEKRDLELLTVLTAELPDHARILVLGCAMTCRPVTSIFMAPDALKTEWAMNLEYDGVTNIEEMARMSRLVFEGLGSERARKVLYIGDGRASAGPLAAGLTFAREIEAANATLHVVGDSAAGSTPELGRLASLGNGTVNLIGERRLEMAVEELVANLATTPMSNIEVTLPEAMEMAYPKSLPSLRPGESATIVARVADRGRVDSVALTGMVGAKKVEQLISLDEIRTRRPIVSTAWAVRRIADLNASEFGGPESERLSKLYQVPAPGTSFVATGEEVVVEQGRTASGEPIGFGNIGLQPRRGASGGVSERGKGLPRKPRRTTEPGEESASVRPTGRVDHRPTGRVDHRPTGRVDHRPTGYRVHLTPGRPSVSGDYEIASVRRVVRQHRDGLHYCIAANAYGARPGRHELEMKLVFAPDGAVKKATIVRDGTESDAISRCVLAKAQRWIFPKSKSGKAITVLYPFDVVIPKRDRHPHAAWIPADAPKDDALPEEVRTFGGEGSRTIASGPNGLATDYSATMNSRHQGVEMATFDHGVMWGRVVHPAHGRDRGSLHLRHAYYGQVRAAWQELEHHLEMGTPDARTWINAARLEGEPAFACAYLQAAASFADEKIPECGPTSDLAWLRLAPKPSSVTSPAVGGDAITVTVRGTRKQRIMLVDEDLERHWWFEPGRHATCEPFEVTAEDGEEKVLGERCVFRELPDGLYGVRLVPPLFDEPELTLEVETSDGKLVREVATEAIYAATIAVGDVTVEAPTVTSSAVPSYALWESSARALHDVIAYCHIGESELPRKIEVKFRVEPSAEVVPKSMSPAPREVSACVRETVPAIKLPNGPEKGFRGSAVYTFWNGRD